MANETTTFGYNPATGDLTSITSQQGRQLTFGYDGAHRVTSVTQQYPGHTNSVTGYNYSVPGQTSVTDPDNHPAAVYSIDSSLRVTKIVDAAGQPTATTWSGDSQPATVTDAYNQAVDGTYGANNGESLTKAEDADTVTASAGYTNPAGAA